MWRTSSPLCRQILVGFLLTFVTLASDAICQDTAKLFLKKPTIRPNPIQRAPLIAIAEFECSEKVLATVLITDGTNSWEQPPTTSAKEKHSIAVMGLRPGRSHRIQVRVQVPGETETETSDPMEFTTDPLPANFPPIRTLLSKPEKMEPGVTLFAINFWNNSTSILDYGFIIAVNEKGEVVWFCNTRDRIADMRFTKAGTLIYQHGSYRSAYEIDLLGRDLHRWTATNLTELPNDGLSNSKTIPVKVDTIHHDLVETESGSFLTLATELRRFLEFPTSEFTDKAPWSPAYVVCDRIIEFAPDSGKIVNELYLKDVLDTRRFGYMALSGFWKDKYNDYLNNEKSRDWSHANALVHLPEEDAVIVSLRHLDCVIKIDWKTKKIKWILGNHDNWSKPWHKYLLKPEGDLQWFYHQHAPQVTERGTIMMFDNGNYRASPFVKATLAPENRSRVVEYEIDEQAMTVKQVYAFDGGDEERFYSPFYCEADLQPKTKNILVTDGGHIELEDGTPDDNVPADRQWARIFEITPGENPEKVFELQCMSPLGSPYGWSIYRSIRLPNLYEGMKLVTPGVAETDDLLYPREQHQKRERPLNAKF